MGSIVALSKKIILHRNISTIASSGPKNGNSKVRIFLRKFKDFTEKYPICRGMITYSFIWPTSNLCQQIMCGRKEIDFVEALRFCLYGTCFVAPTLHLWLRLATVMFPRPTIKSALARAIVEQFTYTPFAMACFFFIMTLLEGKSLEAASTEVQVKFIPTYKVGACVWPVLQTINHTLVPERNRVPFVGMCSLLWTCFLAYMKKLEAEQLAAKKLEAKKLTVEKRAAQKLTAEKCAP